MAILREAQRCKRQALLQGVPNPVRNTESLGTQTQAHMINGQVRTKDAVGCGLWESIAGKASGVEGLHGTWMGNEKRRDSRLGTQQESAAEAGLRRRVSWGPGNTPPCEGEKASLRGQEDLSLPLTRSPSTSVFSTLK